MMDQMSSMLEEHNQTEQQYSRRMAKHAKNTSHFRKKDADYTGINKDLWPGVLGLIAFFISFWIAYGMLYNFFVISQASVKAAKVQIVEVNLILNRMSEAVTSLYTYIEDDNVGLLIRNTPLAVEWDTNFEILSSTNQFFGKLRNENFGSYTPAIITLLSGDLCGFLTDSDASCYSEGKGAKTQGLIGINTYFLNLLASIKEAYDSSNKTSQAKSAVYNTDDYAEMDRIYYFTIIPGYQQLQQVSELIFLKVMTIFQKNTFIINIVYMFAFIGLGRLYWVTALEEIAG